MARLDYWEGRWVHGWIGGLMVIEWRERLVDIGLTGGEVYGYMDRLIVSALR